MPYLILQLHGRQWKRIYTAKTWSDAYRQRDRIYAALKRQGKDRPTLTIEKVEPGSRKGLVRRGKAFRR